MNYICSFCDTKNENFPCKECTKKREKGKVYLSAEDIYLQATLKATGNNQVVGEKRAYYVTLQQLEFIIVGLQNNIIE